MSGGRVAPMERCWNCRGNGQIWMSLETGYGVSPGRWGTCHVCRGTGQARKVSGALAFMVILGALGALGIVLFICFVALVLVNIR